MRNEDEGDKAREAAVLRLAARLQREGRHTGFGGATQPAGRPELFLCACRLIRATSEQHSTRTTDIPKRLRFRRARPVHKLMERSTMRHGPVTALQVFDCEDDASHGMRSWRFGG